jgi:hypothetical protein
MVERGHRSGLTPETLAYQRLAGDLGFHQLQCDWAVEPQLAGPVEDPDPPGADDSLDLIAGDGGTGGQHYQRSRSVMRPL